MKVVILCGGKGTRLREETEYRPKPMVPVGGYPILWHIMKTYAHYGHKDFVLCLGYKREMIAEYFRNYMWNTSDVTLNLGPKTSAVFNDSHQEEDWNVTLANTGEESMTGYRVRSIRRYIGKGENFLLTYGDGVGPIDIPASIRDHEKSGKVCTITAVHPPGRFGAISIDEDGGIHSFEEKPVREFGYINAGYMVCSDRLFDYLPDDPASMLENEPMNRLAADKQLHSFRHEGFWQPMDTLQEMAYLNRLWRENKAPWKIWT
jgi:glucose-1-phosphate cytidylyltransferase